IAGPDASDLISELSLGIEMGATIADIALTIHPHPTLPEAIMESAEAALGEAIHVLNRCDHAGDDGRRASDRDCPGRLAVGPRSSTVPRGVGPPESPRRPTRGRAHPGRANPRRTRTRRDPRPSWEAGGRPRSEPGDRGGRTGRRSDLSRARPARRLSDPPTPGPPRGETARDGPRGGAPPYLCRLRDRRDPGGTRAGRVDGGQEDRVDRARGAAERDVPRLRAQCDDGVARDPADSALQP